MRHVIVLALLVTLLALGGAHAAHAQDNSISFGETVSGNITDAEFEVAYSFTGQANSIVAILMSQEGREGGLEQPEIILLNASNKVVASTSDHYSGHSALLVMQLPDDQEYTIIATRRDGRSGESIGKFRLTLVELHILTEGESIVGEVTSDEFALYAIESSQLFVLDYEQTGGDFHPEVSLNTLDEDFSLDSVASLQGERLIGGSLALRPKGPTLFIVKLGEALFDWNFDEVSATYTLSLSFPDTQNGPSRSGL